MLNNLQGFLPRPCHKCSLLFCIALFFRLRFCAIELAFVNIQVKFFGSNHKSLVQINHLACIEAADTFDLSEISAGCRVVANFKDEGEKYRQLVLRMLFLVSRDVLIVAGVYSGVVAEACDQEMNGNRLLIFFDDGYAMYCWPKHVYLVHGPQTEVWRDITHQWVPLSCGVFSRLSDCTKTISPHIVWL